MTEEQRPNAGETSEVFDARVAQEVAELDAHIADSAIDPGHAEVLRALLVEKHTVERELNAVFPDLQAFEEYKAMQSFSHVPRHVPAPEAIGEVSAPTDEEGRETVGAPENDRWHGIAARINKIDLMGRDRRRAVNALKNGKELGLRARADMLERELAKFPDDESAMSEEELARKRQVTEEYEIMVGREKHAHNDAELFERAMTDEIAQVIREFEQLPEELQGAIRDGNEEILRHYDINMWAAEQVALAIKEKEYADERELHAIRVLEDRLRQDRISGRATWQTIASVIDTPQFALFSRDDIEAALKERGIPTDDMKAGIALLRDAYANEHSGSAMSVEAYQDAQSSEATRKTHQVPRGTFMKGATLSGLYEIRDDGHIYNTNEQGAQATKLDELSTPSPETVEARSHEEVTSAPLLERWEAGKNVYSSFTDAEKYADERFAHTMRLWGMRKSKRPATRFPDVIVPQDPSLTGVYELRDGAVINNEGTTVVEAVQEKKEVSSDVEELLRSLSASDLEDLKRLKRMHIPDIDEEVAQAVIDGLADKSMDTDLARGNVLPLAKGTLAAEAVSKMIRTLRARQTENIAALEDAARRGKVPSVEAPEFLGELGAIAREHDDLPSLEASVQAQNAALDNVEGYAQALRSQNAALDRLKDVQGAIASRNAELDRSRAYGEALQARNAVLDRESLNETTTPAERLLYHLSGARDLISREGGITPEAMKKEGATDEEIDTVMRTLIREGLINQEGGAIAPVPGATPTSPEEARLASKLELRDSEADFRGYDASQHAQEYASELVALHLSTASSPEEALQSLEDEINKEAAAVKARGRDLYAKLLVEEVLPRARAMLLDATPESADKENPFFGIQAEYFGRNTELIRALGDASREGDNERVRALEKERMELDQWYEQEISRNFPEAPETVKPEAATTAETLRTKESLGLDEVGSLWASFIEREYGINIDGEELSSAEEAALIVSTEAWDTFISEARSDEEADEAEEAVLEYDGNSVDILLPISIEEFPIVDEAIETEEDHSFDETMNMPGAWDPEAELEKIRALGAGKSKQEREELIAEYKRTLAWQRQGLGKVQELMIADLRLEPDLSQEEFARRFIERIAQYRATARQIETGLRSFERYQRLHAEIVRFFEAFSDPKEMYTACFGASPVGEVEVIRGPMTIYFRCHSDEDYARVYEALGSGPVSPEAIVSSKRSGGAAMVQTRIPELYGAVIVERAEGRPFTDGAKKIHEHEEQHALHAILKSEQEEGENFEPEILEAMERMVELSEQIKTIGIPEREALARAELDRTMSEVMLKQTYVLRKERAKIADQRAADEILAFMRDGTPGDQIFTALTKKNIDGGLYDYLEKATSLFVSPTRSFEKETIDKFPDLVREIDERFARVRNGVMGEEYTDLLRSGIAIYEKMRQAGMHDEVIRTIFQHEPLSRWEKVGERMLEHTPEPIYFAVVKQFEEKFGVAESDLESLPAFTRLSSGQQLLVLKNLEQATLTKVRKEAKSQQEEEWKNTKFWKKGLQMILTLGTKPEMRRDEIEKELLAKEEGKNPDQLEARRLMANKLAHIESLAKVAELGPEVTIGEKGKIEIGYVNPRDIFESLDDKHLNPESLRAITNYNTAANAFAKLPQEWGADLDRLSRSDRRMYQKTKKAYDRARIDMLSVMEGKFSEADPARAEERAMLAMNRLDEQVTTNQLYNTHPDAEKALLEIKNTPTIVRAAKEFWKSKGAFMTYGAAARAAAVAISGTVALPVIAASAGLVGMGIGRRQGQQVVNERRHDGRMSEEDAREVIEFTTYKKLPDGSPEKDKKGNKIPTGKGKRKIREFTDATFFVDRIDRLTQKLAVTTDRSERALIEKKLAQTTVLMKEKLSRGMINFGGSSLASGDTRKGAVIANKLAFMQSMSKGAIESSVDKTKLMSEAAALVGTREERIEKVRSREVNVTTAKAAASRALFALAGGIAFQYAREWWHGGHPSHAPGSGRTNDLFDPDSAPRVPRVAQEAGGAEILIERRVIHPQELQFIEGMSRKLHRALSLEEGRALWRTMPRNGAEPTEDFLKNTPAGRAHIDLIAKFFQRGKPLSEEEIAAIFKKEGFDPKTGRPLIDELGISYQERIDMPEVRLPTSTPAAPPLVERGAVDPNWSETPARLAQPTPPPQGPARVLERPAPPAPSRAVPPLETVPQQPPVRIPDVPPAPRPPVEMAPPPRIPTVTEIMQSVASIESRIGRDLTGAELVTIKSLRTLEAAADPSEVSMFVKAREALADMMVKKRAPLSARDMYETLRQFGLEKKVTVTPDDELRQMMAR